MNHRSQKRLIALLIIAALAVAGYTYATPYLVLHRLKQAADARDAVMVDRYVDYPSLRVSLKEQVTELLMRRVDAQKREHPLAAIGALVGMALISPLVDAYATPDGVAALLNGLPPRGEPGETPPAPPSDATSGAPRGESAQSSTESAAPEAEHKPSPRTSAGYRSFDEFVVTYEDSGGHQRYSAIFERYGWFSWKLAAVDLNR
ncbi:DUF2939 domain-containing protein [Trinickia fusca]|uniref:DUF2939 domain-containing protein n=1 Tax=Trinickia fusca TaxID=2419777 RepID=A0A494XP20_9BURK|nr:DUF2939 domain-containing protein [Trinickia fusca]RKP52368.1 DUF2939 domain-containing protein [Trinickia fusca]